ncbi:MAG: pilin [Patescibacteria group bacterium]
MNKQKRNRLILVILLGAVVLMVLPAVANAAFSISKGIVGNLSPACQESGTCGFCDWIDLFMILQKVILSLFGGLAVVLMIWAGQGLITAAGNEEKIKQAKNLMLSTVIGIVMVLAGYFLVSLVIGILLRPANADPKQGLPVTIFGVNWSNAYCRDMGDPKYCESRSEGTSCGKYKDGTCQKQGSKNVCVQCAGLPDGTPCGRSQDRTACLDNNCVPACVGQDGSNYFICLQNEEDCSAVSGTRNLGRVCTEPDSPVCCSAP